MAVAVAIVPVPVAEARVAVDPGALEVQSALDFVLVSGQHVGADEAAVSRLPPQWKFAASSVLPLPL